MSVCRKCGNYLDDNSTFCRKCGTNVDNTIGNRSKQYTPYRKNKSKAPIIISIIISIIMALMILAGILQKDNIMYNYYVIRGNNESVPSKCIEYYAKALNKKYDKEIVAKITNKIKEDEDFEQTLENASYVLNEEDLNKAYGIVYVKEAKEQYEKKDYEKSKKYLDKAELYGYETEKFEYYEELAKIEEQKQKIEEQKQKAEENKYQLNQLEQVSVYDNIEYEYLVYDSNTRYLTRSELINYSRDELGYIRNEIFARHGYVFSSGKYREYFSSKSWYEPNVYFEGNENDLSDVEKANIKLIQELEGK